ncbi:hypothetical protein [Bacillus sp. MUM 13]|uniref:hypothetical protein n=1 Tax=Bacillus sp. MUM 13 TaxID=1678001 RepID=UPI0008F58482|nr:hypothetical protein [Bacillus sp. MUM 13]OIK08331.1 hypothetical protein BIV59_20365 [Bacillus sp. MUM 13]
MIKIQAETDHCGYAVCGAVYIGVAEIHSITGLVVLFILYRLYSSLTKGIENTLVVDMANPKNKGEPWKRWNKRYEH